MDILDVLEIFKFRPSHLDLTAPTDILRIKYIKHKSYVLYFMNVNFRLFPCGRTRAKKFEVRIIGQILRYNIRIWDKGFPRRNFVVCTIFLIRLIREVSRTKVSRKISTN
jgi:hypothetical protein